MNPLEELEKAERMYTDPEDRAALKIMRDQIARLTLRKDFIAHEDAKHLIELLHGQITDADQKLANDRTLTESQRQYLWGMKDAVKVVLGFFEVKVDEQLASITETVREYVVEA